MTVAFEKILLGISLAAPLGPVSIEMIRRGVKDGFWAAFSVRLGAAIGNTLCLVFACIGINSAKNYPLFLNTIGAMGSFYLLYMGICALRSKSAIDFSPISEKNGLRKGFYFAIANPVALVFWTSMFAASDSLIENRLLNLLIIVGVLIWGAALSALLHFFKQYLSERMIIWVCKISSTGLIFFGVKYLYRSYVALLRALAV
jgi:threonine/homoserine/homoserine lactone efflux protein